MSKECFHKRIKILILTFILSVPFSTFAAPPPQVDSLPDAQKKISELFKIIYGEYVEKIGSDTLVRWSMEGILKNLDPFSAYIMPKAFKRFKEATKGYFGGLGIEITIKDDYITVVAPIEGTPADSAGVEPGDQIATIKNEDTDLIDARGLSLQEAVQILRGKVGTPVTIGVLRDNETAPVSITLIREIIKIKSVRKSFFEDDIAYIRLSKFKEISPKEFDEAVKVVNEKHSKSLVLDLRNNPGGLLDSVVKIASVLLPAGKIVVSTLGRNPHLKKVYVTSPRSVRWDGNLVVLINRGSASGSEIIAGAIQDHKRGVVMGGRSFGKASVQNVKSLADGTGLKLTIAKYYTPDNRMIHGKGIHPDIELIPPPVRKRKIKKDTKEDTSAVKKNKDEPEKIDEVKDFQLKKALQFLKYYDMLAGRKE